MAGPKADKKNIKKKPDKRERIKRTYNAAPLHWIVVAGIISVLILSPFFRGLYFDYELLYFQIAVGVLFLIYSVKKYLDGAVLFKDTAVLFGLILTLCYLISFVFAADYRLAFGTVLKYLTYAFLMMMAAGEIKDKRDIYIVLNGIIIAGVAVAIAGIGSAAGTFDIDGGFVGGRINSTLQYPNTLASLMMAVYFIAVALMGRTDKFYMRIIYAGAAYTLFHTFIFTYSRGAWVMFPVLALLFVILSKDRWLETLINGILTVAPIVLTLQGFGSAIAADPPAGVWRWFFIGLIASLVLGLLAYIIDRFAERVDRRKAVAAFAILLIAACIAGYIALTSTTPLTYVNDTEKDTWQQVIRYVDVKPDTGYTLEVKVQSENRSDKPWAYQILIQSIDNMGVSKDITAYNPKSESGTAAIDFKTYPETQRVRIYFRNLYAGTSVTFSEAVLRDGGQETIIPLRYRYIPESLVTRMQDITLSTQSSSERLIFYRDAFKMFKASPVFGFGGGGWQAAYFAFQSYTYWTTQAHNYFAQVMVETGILGLAALAGLLLSLLYVSYRIWKGTEDVYTFLAPFMAVLSLYAHSAMDFDLSLSAMSFILWTLMGVILAEGRIYSIDMGKMKLGINFRPGYGIVLSVIMAIVSSSLSYAISSALKGSDEAKRGDLDKAIYYYSKAVTFDRLSPDYRADYSKILMTAGDSEKDKEKIDMAKGMIESAVVLARYDSSLYAQLTAFYLSRGMIDDGLKAIEKSVEVQPYRPQNYIQKADAYYKVGMAYLNEDKKDEAKKYFEVVSNLREEIQKANKKALRPMDLLPETVNYIERADYVLANIDSRGAALMADRILLNSRFDIDINNDNTPDFWRVAQGKDSNLTADFKDGQAVIKNSGTGEGFLIRGSLTLEPDTKYALVFLAKGTVNPAAFEVFVLSPSGQNVQFNANNIQLADKTQVYNYEFTTTGDIKPGNQYIRFDHNGNDPGEIDISSVMLIKLD
ncbi:MAG: O-antigen ligase family protein [Thermoanaerobacteraceae bacterium]|nr:O-antigen ligase family protein [Thermoanaerobacteraceae bacterium]